MFSVVFGLTIWLIINVPGYTHSRSPYQKLIVNYPLFWLRFSIHHYQLNLAEEDNMVEIISAHSEIPPLASTVVSSLHDNSSYLKLVSFLLYSRDFCVFVCWKFRISKYASCISLDNTNYRIFRLEYL